MAAPTQEQQQQFAAAATEHEKAYPGFFDRLAQAQKHAAASGVDLPIAARDEIIILRSPEALDKILTSEQEKLALHVAPGEYVNDERVIDHVRRLHSRVQRNEEYKTITAQESDTDKYLRQRREDRY